jgi:Mce-associated membrane protein
MTSSDQATLDGVSADLDPDESTASSPSAPSPASPTTGASASTEPAPSPSTEPAPDKPKKPSKKQAKIEALEAKIRELETEPTASTRGRRRLLVPVVVGVAIVVLAVAVVVTGVKLRHADQVSSARSSGLAAARVYGADLSTYSYQHLTADFAAVSDHSTPSFAKTFSKQTALLTPVLTKYKATAQATVLAAGVTSASANRVVVVVLVSQKVTNSVQKSGPTTDRSQVVLTLVRHDGHWLLDAAQLL